MPPSTSLLLTPSREDERTLVEILRQLEPVARTQTPDAHLCGRVKQWPSVVAKAKRLGVDLAQVLDRLGTRIVVRHPRECYRVMDSLHASFAHVPGQYDDYVAWPKPNGYQALHSILVDAHGRAFEVQVRTRAMHQRALRGTASHDEYKRSQFAPRNETVTPSGEPT